MTGDAQVGRNVAKLRGDRPQQAVADRMRERGWKWVKATLWALEKGDRSLKLLEAVDLAEVLGVELTDLYGSVTEAEARRLGRALNLSASAIYRANEEFSATVEDAIDELDSLHRAGEDPDSRAHLGMTLAAAINGVADDSDEMVSRVREQNKQFLERAGGAT